MDDAEEAGVDGAAVLGCAARGSVMMRMRRACDGASRMCARAC